MSVVGAQVRAILRNVSDRKRLRMGEVCMPSPQNRFVWLSVVGRVQICKVQVGLRWLQGGHEPGTRDWLTGR